MNGLEVKLTLDRDHRSYLPGETLSGHFLVSCGNPNEIKAVELSVLWFTEGKGDEDLAVHFFDRLEQSGGMQVDLRQPCKFSTRLPSSPLSYEGVIVKICWCVRVRVFPLRGSDVVIEEPFRLGVVPPAKWVSE